MSPDQVFVIVMGSIAAWTLARVFRGPLGEAVARLIGGAVSNPGQGDQQISDLQARVAKNDPSNFGEFFARSGLQ